MSSIHVERAKKWGASPWLAEWLDRTVTYCKGEGKSHFEAWAIQRYGRAEGRKIIADSSKPAKKIHDLKAPGKGLENIITWNKASMELGVTDETLRTYHLFADANILCCPPRVLPAPKRKRGESSADWIARRHDALLRGCKVPNMDWRVVRAISLSEYDRTRDMAEEWRRDFGQFFQGLVTRANSTIPSPQILNRPKDEFRKITISDAFRSQNYALHDAHNCWHFATQLFEDLARRGLCTPPAIEKAYMRDDDLMWRLVGCGTRVKHLRDVLWGKVRQVVTYSEYYRPYFKRWRSPEGLAYIDQDMRYRNSHPIESSEMDAFILHLMSDASGDTDIVGFYDTFSRFMVSDPSNAKKFSEEAYEALGDYAVASEFYNNMVMSPFGVKLRAHSFTKGADRLVEGMLRHVSPMDPRALNFDPETYNPTLHQAGMGTAIHIQLMDVWHTYVTHTHVDGAQEAASYVKKLYGEDYGEHKVDVLDMWDQQWRAADEYLWEMAHKMDRPDEPGRIAREFGLVDPNGRNRPSFVRGFLDATLRQVLSEIKPESTPAPASTRDHVPVFPTGEAASQSGHSFVSQSEKPKKKIKRKGQRSKIEVSEPMIEEDDDDSLDKFPDLLPTSFKLPRKILKIFHNILDIERDGSNDANAPQRGQVRWGDFERAMKRVGFEVIQTAGSSVRFDPPARTARPISFHRPHPDSILHPHMLKCVGARLRRCYGWTNETFELGPAEEQKSSVK